MSTALTRKFSAVLLFSSSLRLRNSRSLQVEATKLSTTHCPGKYLVKPLPHEMPFDEQAWYGRYISYVRSRDLNPADPFYEGLLKKIFDQEDEYWTTLGIRLTDARDDQIAYESVYTMREAYRNQPMILQHFRLGTIWYNVHILSDLIHLLHKSEESTECL